jgi:hypothetical protein
MGLPTSDRERFAILVRMSAESWLQSRAALYLAIGNDTATAASKARAAFTQTYGDVGIDVTHFQLDRV